LISDPDIIAGQAARRNGRYDLAVAAFQRAGAHTTEARTLEFRALREVDISRHLIDRLLRRVGMPAARYKGFAAIEPPLDGAAVSGRLAALANDTAAGDLSRRLLEADGLVRGAPGMAVRPPDDHATNLDLRAARARHALRSGDSRAALAQLAGAVPNDAPSADAQAILGRGLWQTGDAVAAANAFNLSLLYLEGTNHQGQLRFQTAYKEFRIVYHQGQFYAIPDWRDPIVYDSDGEAKVVVHRLPRWLRYGMRRYVPSRLLDFMKQAMSMVAFRGEVRLDQQMHAPDLITLLNTVDKLRKSRR